jgi:fructose-bisphosphate aldolase class I
MSLKDLETTAHALVARGKGMFAADETVAALTRRLAARAIDSTPESRRAYRELFLSTPGVADIITGVILHEETVRQHDKKGIGFPALLARQGIVTGIKVDLGARPWAGSSGEHMTAGLDGLGDRLREYRALGARFAKWRAAILISETRPSPSYLRDTARAFGRYSAICQQHGIVPIVAPEVMMDGNHTIGRCEEVTAKVLHAVFRELLAHKCELGAVVLSTNMVVPGTTCAVQTSPDDVAAATLRCLARHVPSAVPEIAFLSGGQDPLDATIRLNAIARLAGPKPPWFLTFSFGRALQDEALTAWGGWPDRIEDGQRAFLHRGRLVAAAAMGRYSPGMEDHSAVA